MRSPRTHAEHAKAIDKIERLLWPWRWRVAKVTTISARLASFPYFGRLSQARKQRSESALAFVGRDPRSSFPRVMSALPPPSPLPPS